MGNIVTDSFYVYTYCYPDGTPFYVGKGKGRRKNVHLCDAKAGRRTTSYVVRVINKLLKNNQKPVITKIVENVDEEFAFFVEEEFIAKYGRRDMGTGILTNGTSGGDGVYNTNEATRKIQTDTAIMAGAKTRFSKGSVPWNKGEAYSPERIEQMRQISTGKIRSPEANRLCSLKNKGRVFEKVTCNVCGKTGGLTSMKRWHFEKCTGTHQFRARATIDGKRIHLGRFDTQEEAHKKTVDYYNMANKPLPKELVKNIKE